MDLLQQYIRGERLTSTRSFQRILVSPAVNDAVFLISTYGRRRVWAFPFREVGYFFTLSWSYERKILSNLVYTVGYSTLYLLQISLKPLITVILINHGRSFQAIESATLSLSLLFFYTGQNPTPSRVATSTRPAAGGVGRIGGGAQRSQGISRPGQQPARSTGGAAGASAALMQKDTQIQELNNKVCWVAF